MENDNVTKRDFIQKTLICEMGQIKDEHPYLAFALMSIGIEFLGKILNNKGFSDSKNAKADFDKAIQELNAFKKYRPYNITLCAAD